MAVIVKEAIEVVGSVITGKYGAWSITELASYLQNAGNFSSYERAWQAVTSSPEYWYSRVAQFESATNPIDYGVLRRISGGAADAVSSTTETALEVAQGNTLAASTSEVSTATVTVAETAPNTFSLKALLTMDVGIMAAAVAPVLGVSLGAELYSANPELWGKISQTLLPFCYDDTTMAPVWAGIDAIGNWEISVCRDAVNALRDLFAEEGFPTINPGTEYATSDLTTSIAQPIPYHTEYMTFTTPDGGTGSVVPSEGAKYVFVEYTGSLNRLCILAVSGEVVTITRWIYEGREIEDVLRHTPEGTYTYNGETVNFTSNLSNSIVSAYRWPNITPDISVEDALNDVDKIAWTIEYGNSSPYGPGEYQDGTERWEGDIPSKYFSDPIIDEDGNPVETVPISPPMNIPDTWKPGTPAPSGNPEDQSYPDVIYDPEKQISPYLSPLPTPKQSLDPNPIPISDPGSEPDPSSDPSQPTPPPTSFIDPVPIPPAPTGDSPVPNMPTTSPAFSSNVGLVTVYHPNDAQLYAFESWLWVTYADATIDKIWNNPFDGVITLFELYCTPTDIGTRNIHCGFLDSGVNSPIISRYTEIDCGSLGIPEWYGNYLDYSPYTKAHIYLPFIGIQELNPDDIVGHGVNVTYRIDEYNGSCIAMITVAKSTTVNGEEVEYSNTMYQFSGNCAVELPITGGSQASIKAGMMQADAYQMAGLVSTGTNLLGGIGSALMGSLGGAISGVAGAASSYAYAQANYLSNMLSGKSTVQKSGSFGASHGALGIKTPFITITRPKQIQVANYEKLYGYPAHKMVTIGACTGFLRCREVNVVSATANDEEKALIEQLLKAGVYVTE